MECQPKLSAYFMAQVGGQNKEQQTVTREGSESIPNFARSEGTHSIVQAHGGRIVVDSRQGEGSTFTVLLPES